MESQNLHQVLCWRSGGKPCVRIQIDLTNGKTYEIRKRNVSRDLWLAVSSVQPAGFLELTDELAKCQLTKE